MQVAELLHTPVTFKIEVGGRKLEAAFLSASFEDGAGYRLNITFSDGHNDHYELDCAEVYNSRGKQDRYCQALKNEIYLPLRGWSSGTLVTVISYPIDNKLTNIWIVQKEGYSSVYFNNLFQFKVEKKAIGWVIKSGEGTTIDEELLKKVKAVVKYYLQEA